MMHRLMSTPARRRVVLVPLTVTVVGAALVYGPTPTPWWVLALLALTGITWTGAAWILAGSTHPSPPPTTPGHDKVSSTPTGATAGYWDGLKTHGPGYTADSVHCRVSAGTWPDRPHAVNTDVVSCACGNRQGLALIWLTSRPDLTLFRCPCGISWRDPAWSTPDAVAFLMDQQVIGEAGPTDPAEADPAMTYLGEMLKREAGNEPRPHTKEADDLW